MPLRLDWLNLKPEKYRRHVERWIDFLTLRNEDFKKQVKDGVVALIGVADGKAAVTVAVTGAAVGKLSAVDLARAAVTAMGGQGAGGKPDFAQGGAPDGSKAADGLAAIKAALA